MNYETLFVNLNGRTSRAQFMPAMATVIAVMAFYAFVVSGRTAQFCMVVLLYPAFVLLARRLRDMGYTAWLVLAPLVLVLAAYAIQLGYFSMGDAIDAALPWAALVFSTALILWACLSRAKK